MKIKSEDFRVQPGHDVTLQKWPKTVKPFLKSKKQYHKLLEEHVDKLSELQRLHYASDRYALLLIFQGMDAAGKDGVIRHVMSGVNPQGCRVVSFKQPSAEELEYDFLRRVIITAEDMAAAKGYFLHDCARLCRLQGNLERYMILVVDHRGKIDQLGRALLAAKLSDDEWTWEPASGSFMVRMWRLPPYAY